MLWQYFWERVFLEFKLKYFVSDNKQRIDNSLVIKYCFRPKHSMYNLSDIIDFFKYVSFGDQINDIARVCLQISKYWLINRFVLHNEVRYNQLNISQIIYFGWKVENACDDCILRFKDLLLLLTVYFNYHFVESITCLVELRLQQIVLIRNTCCFIARMNSISKFNVFLHLKHQLSNATLLRLDILILSWLMRMISYLLCFWFFGN